MTIRLPRRIVVIVALVSVLLPVATGAAEGVRLNLRDAELRAFIELVARVTGRNFIVDPRVRGTVTIVAPEMVEPDAVYRIFLNVLQLNRLAVVVGDGADRIVPMQLARELPTREEVQPAASDRGFVTRALPVEHMSLDEAMQIIRPLLPAEAVLTAYPTGHLLIVSDRESNVGRIETLLGRLDRPRVQEVEVVTLRNAAAKDVVETLAALELTFPDAKVTADDRSNALLISGTAAFRAQVRRLATELDRPRNITDATVVRLRYADAAKIETVVSKLFKASPVEGQGGEAVVADVTTNSILISAPPDRLSSLVAAVKALDQRPSQVLVEGVIFEMGAEKFAQLGVQFAAVISNIFAGGIQFSVGEAPGLGSLVTSLLAGNAPALGSGVSVAAGALGEAEGAVGFISALARDATTNILATPSILTLDNTTAEIVVAQNVPFVTGRFSTVGDTTNPERPFQTIQRQDVGLTLRVTPQITADDTVRLRVEQEVSNLTAAAAASGGEITQRRAIDTSILVGDRRLVLLGGLLEDQSSSTGEKVPGLGDLPVLEYLFGAKADRETKRILLLLLRPTIIRSDAEYAEVTESRYNRARARDSAIRSAIDDRYPRSGRHRLPALMLTLEESFGSDAPPDTGDGTTLMPPLPPRLRFDDE